MKKIGIVILFLIGIIGLNNVAKAQLNNMGLGIVLATGGEYKLGGLPYYNKSFGIDLRTCYDFNKKIKITPALRFYLPNNENYVTGGESKTTVFVFNLNAHYIVNPRSEYKLYLLGGAHVGAWKIKDKHTSFITNDVDVNTFRFAPGLNLGGGMQFYLGPRWQFFAEVKYIVANTNQMAFSPGLYYDF